MNPEHSETQSQLSDWIHKHPHLSLEELSHLDFVGFQKLTKQYLEELAKSESIYTGRKRTSH
jgi:uncharacterized protein